jgi:hypothetical protein
VVVEDIRIYKVFKERDTMAHGTRMSPDSRGKILSPLPGRDP